ncbi:MAG: UMP kinase [Candidatus Puniceispirillum sp.]|nr:UMP kinase [Candidatus Puniceispirillum sp.]
MVKDDTTRPYRRLLIKLSGEALMGSSQYGIDPGTVQRIASEIQTLHDDGFDLCIVVGGGNIFRGVNGEAQGIDRVTSDHMGMLATVMNALALQNALEHLKIYTRVVSAIPMPAICEPYIQRRCMRHLEKRRVIIFAAGSGHPFFTTDSAAVLRASEMGCEVLLKGTKVDGVYCSDPAKNNEARRFERLGYGRVLQDKLAVMDMAAIAMARDNHLPLIVFSIQEPGALVQVAKGQGRFTLIQEQEDHHHG